MDGGIEAIKETGLTLREWGPAFLINLRACGDYDPSPTTAQERWIRARKCRDIPLPQNTSSEKIEMKRCPRCCGGYPKGMMSCTSCGVIFALQAGSVLHYPNPGTSNPDREQSHAIVINGSSEPIWVPSTQAEKQAAASAAEAQPTRDVTQLLEEAQKMMEYNQPRIDALPAGTTKDRSIKVLQGVHQGE